MLSLKPLVPQRREMDTVYDFFEDFLNDSFPMMNRLKNDGFKIDVKENEEAYTVEAELPGISKDQIKIEYHVSKLYICTSQVNEKNDENDRYIHRERTVSQMQRGVYLRNVNYDGIQASLENGILTITAPKIENKAERHRIEIK